MKANLLFSSFLPNGGKRPITYQPDPRNITESMAVPARVLLVDDARGDIILAQRRLLGAGGMGCDLSIATSAPEAMETLITAASLRRPIDLVLLDISLPGENGFALLDRIRAHPRLTRTPVIMCTGSDHEADRHHARLLGIVGYMVKPASLEQLKSLAELLPRLDVVEDALGLRLTVTRAMAN